MCIVAHGIDVVDVERFSKLIDKGGDEFLKRCFVKAEILEASYNTNERLSAWFAVKEAVLKAIGTGFSEGASFVDIEVIHNDAGAPSVALVGRTKEIADSMGITKWFVSLSHIGKVAVASVIGSNGEH
jgi:holo-[acyl-carrier protein] synthase